MAELWWIKTCESICKKLTESSVHQSESVSIAKLLQCDVSLLPSESGCKSGCCGRKSARAGGEGNSPTSLLPFTKHLGKHSYSPLARPLSSPHPRVTALSCTGIAYLRARHNKPTHSAHATVVCMSIENLKTFDPFAEADEGTGEKSSAQSQDYIHIRIQRTYPPL